MFNFILNQRATVNILCQLSQFSGFILLFDAVQIMFKNNC